MSDYNLQMVGLAFACEACGSTEVVCLDAPNEDPESSTWECMRCGCVMGVESDEEPA